MIDFLMIATRSTKRGVIEIYPRFIICKSEDLMIRGGDFYAIWLEERGLWSTDEQDALQLIDRELDQYAKENSSRFASDTVKVLHMWDSENGMIDRWHKYCQKHMRDEFHMLDDKLIFSNMKTVKKDYASKKLHYPLEEGASPAYERLMSVLYSEEERHKIEWAIGAVVTGDSKKIQKFMVLYGAAGTGKSTVLNIIQQLFDGYYSVFDAKALGSSNNAFALEAFKSNPLVAIQHDGDLSRIEDNTRLNSLVSHELMTVNEKFKSTYASRFQCFLFMGTNKPVKITDAKSGLIRRLIDVSPTGNKVNATEYRSIMKQIPFELGAIAYHCQEVYQADPDCYDSYIPVTMLGASNDFYNFVIDSYPILKKEDGTTLKAAYEMYKTYCDEAKVLYPFSKRVFKEELKNYFRDFQDRFNLDDGTRVRSYYTGFRTEKFETDAMKEEEAACAGRRIEFKEQSSQFDKDGCNYPAQYANEEGTPIRKWENVKTRLSDLDTSKLHYVKVPENHIVIDFDLKDEAGNKSFEKNLAEASKWPTTYAELSKSGAGIHLHYIYSGDVTKLSHIFSENIEVKIFTGNSSLRRKLTKCNALPVATISSGLPLKGERKLVNFDAIKSEKGLRSLIKRNLNKEIHPATKPSIDFIYKILEDAHNTGLKYDVTDMRNAILAFAANSTNQSDYCIKLVNKMPFKSEEPSDSIENQEAKLVFYDVEVFLNLFLVNWKVEGEGKPVVRMINPAPHEIEELMRFRLVGFNCRRYDNHILYARLMGYDNEQLYRLSQKIINGSANCFFGEAYNVSYTDIYDFSSKKQSLKKFEIELGIHHQELGLPWDQPVPKERWIEVAEYCDNDVLATEAVFHARKADFEARKVLAKIAGGTVNDTTNSLTTRLIFGNNRKPQDQFVYTDLSTIFPGYVYENGKSTYCGEETGEGGYVYSEPGMYGNVALLDIASMHPHSAIALNIFGDKYTKRFKDLVDARIAIKHKDTEKLKTIFGGAFAEFIHASDEELSNLASALKIAINSVYGLTSANFGNPFRDSRNKDNIVAKRGALFMINLKHEVQERGFTVAHIKTDSIKIPDATPEIIQFVMDYGKRYGYTFEHEATYDRMCLVNDAVYIAKYKDGKHAGEWTATGKQFAVPYVFKTLFSKEPVSTDDMRETFSVKSALYLDMNEQLPDVSAKEQELKKLEDKYKKGLISDTIFEPESQKLVEEIAKGHDYRFVGKVGEFCPILPGKGGGILCREQNGKYYAPSGTTGYRWLEAEMVLKKTDEKTTVIDETTGQKTEVAKKEGIPVNASMIDVSYYRKLADAAIETISQYGDFEWFVSDDPYIPRPKLEDFMTIPDGDEEELPFN